MITSCILTYVPQFRCLKVCDILRNVYVHLFKELRKKAAANAKVISCISWCQAALR